MFSYSASPRSARIPRFAGRCLAPPPIHTIRRGNLEAGDWQNESTDLRFRRITFARTYGNRDGKVPNTTSFGVHELPALALLIGQSEL